MKKSFSVNRRTFIKTGALSALSAGILSENVQAASAKKGDQDKPEILNQHPKMSYRQLPGTDIYFSKLSLGGSNLKTNMALYAIDHGINLTHMSERYGRGAPLQQLGEAMKTKRDKVYIAFKDNFDDIDKILDILHTDHIDFLMFNRHKKDEVTDPAIMKRFEKYHAQGKVKYAGLTTHGDVKECVAAALETGFYKLIMPVLNQPGLDALDRELKIAQEKEVGIMAMKALKGLDDIKLEQAYIKKALANPAVTTITKGMKSYEIMDTFMKAASESVSLEEDELLYKHAQKNRSKNCMMCGACEKACPQNIQISSILRAKEYYHDECGEKEIAVDAFRNANQNGSKLSTCTVCGECEAVCPNGIAVVNHLSDAGRFFQSAMV